MAAPPKQCLMPQVNAGDHLDGQQVYEASTIPTLQPRFIPLRLLLVSRHERQPQGNQILVNRGAENGIGKLPEKITEEGLQGSVPGLEATHEEVGRCRRLLF